VDAVGEVAPRKKMGCRRRPGAQLIGINNRDLKNLRVDLAATDRGWRARAAGTP